MDLNVCEAPSLCTVYTRTCIYLTMLLEGSHFKILLSQDSVVTGCEQLQNGTPNTSCLDFNTTLSESSLNIWQSEDAGKYEKSSAGDRVIRHRENPSHVIDQVPLMTISALSDLSPVNKKASKLNEIFSQIIWSSRGQKRLFSAKNFKQRPYRLQRRRRRHRFGNL